mmetsp:Transcript_16982/g.41057  ORF Transcript_16982/g.41057 Transcript_16982/m.41057 type:complete len:320 (+) Transcript_16982:686-1645(+)
MSVTCCTQMATCDSEPVISAPGCAGRVAATLAIFSVNERCCSAMKAEMSVGLNASSPGPSPAPCSPPPSCSLMMKSGATGTNTPSGLMLLTSRRVSLSVCPSPSCAVRNSSLCMKPHTSRAQRESFPMCCSAASTSLLRRGVRQLGSARAISKLTPPSAALTCWRSHEMSTSTFGCTRWSWRGFVFAPVTISRVYSRPLMAIWSASLAPTPRKARSWYEPSNFHTYSVILVTVFVDEPKVFAPMCPAVSVRVADSCSRTVSLTNLHFSSALSRKLTVLSLDHSSNVANSSSEIPSTLSAWNVLPSARRTSKLLNTNLSE